MSGRVICGVFGGISGFGGVLDVVWVELGVCCVWRGVCWKGQGVAWVWHYVVWLRRFCYDGLGVQQNAFLLIPWFSFYGKILPAMVDCTICNLFYACHSIFTFAK